MFGHDAERSFASPDKCIDPVSALTFRPKWFFNTNSPVTSQPAVVDGIVYAGAFDGKFYALHASNGKKAWSHAFNTRTDDKSKVDFGQMPGSPAVVTIAGRKLVIVPAGASLFLLDAMTGARVDQMCFDRVDVNCQNGSGRVTEVESSPEVLRAADGNSAQVLVGVDHNEVSNSGPGGVVSVLLDETGFHPRWWFEPEQGKTYAGLAPLEPVGHMTENGCGDVWSSVTVDAASNTATFGMRNCNFPERVQRGPGVTQPELTEGTAAVDLTTGRFKWLNNPRTAAQGRGKDLDFGATPNVLAPGVIGEGSKDGTYYVTDARTGQPIWSRKLSVGSSVGGMIASTAVGQFSNHHQAVFAAAGIPLSTDDPLGTLNQVAKHPTYAFSVHALDTKTHKEKWSLPTLPSYAAPVFDNGVVFVPDTFSAAILVLDADTGLLLRALPMNSVPASPPAISGNSIYVGAGIGENGVPDVVSSVGGIWAFTTTP